MSEHSALPKIRGFHNVYKEFLHLYGDALPNSLTWHAKIKLHGTNAGIRFSPDGTIAAQKRTSDCWVGNDNMGFAAFVERNRSLLERWYADYVNIHGNDIQYDTVICGEWAGPGVQKSVAVSQIPEKQFFVFGIKHVFGLRDDPELAQMTSSIKHKASAIAQYLYGGDIESSEFDDAGIHILPDFGTFTVDPRFKENVEAFVEDLNAKVEAIEACDPYILEKFGIEGIGEGLVFYPHGRLGRDVWCFSREFERMAFKVKGEKHAVNKAGKPARVASATPKGAYDFADMHVTEARLEQGLQELGGQAEKKLTGQFIGWVCRDVAIESADEIAESGLDWKKCLSGVVAARAREWFMKKCEEL
jgi:hypothetical protein